MKRAIVLVPQPSWSAAGLAGGLMLLAAVPMLNGCRTPTSSREPPFMSEPLMPLPVIGHGEEVNLEEHLASGKTTVVDFYSEYCPACVMLAPELEKLVQKRPDIALVKVDVNRPDVKDSIDWESPIARQYNLESLPHLVVFDADGKETASGEKAMDLVMGWLTENGKGERR